MIRQVQIRLTPEDAANPEKVLKAALKKSGAGPAAQVRVRKRSIDARQQQVMLQLVVDIAENEDLPQPDFELKQYPSVARRPAVHIIGCGPAGLFAALTCIQKGYKPIILERGKNVRERRRDLANINRRHVVNPDSNYCFGEGGAGTYSDGKLYTRSDKRGNVRSVLEAFVQFGAHPDILIDAHPHIGTNKLPQIISDIRTYIEAHGGEVHFEKRVTAILHNNGSVTGVECNAAELIPVEKVILATGHSARDIYFMLHSSGIALEFKPFAMGVRIEHPQALIDTMQYHRPERGDLLPPAAYNFVRKTGERSAYSFCMCPGGIIAPCATASEEIVTNGWSPSKRNNPYANSGFVVGVNQADVAHLNQYGPLSGLVFQMEVERMAWEAGGRTQRAPAQRMTDFVNRKVSADLPQCSYQPGLNSVDMHSVLPSFIAESLKDAFLQLQKIQPIYYTADAVIVGVESRTSAPVRIPRDSSTLQHAGVRGLFPCGEGGGYAGGIVSAAIDGMKVAEIACLNQ